MVQIQRTRICTRRILARLYLASGTPLREPFHVKATSETPLPIPFLANHPTTPVRATPAVVRAKVLPPIVRDRATIGGYLRTIYFTVLEWMRASQRPSAVQSHRETITLHADEVLNVRRRSGATQIEVECGTIWLTDTPATGDMLLHAGDRFTTGNHSPYVLQALGAAKISIQRESRR